MPRPYFATVLALLAVWLGFNATQLSAQNLRLIRIEFRGLNRYPESQIAGAAQLRLGQPIDPPMLDAAATRLGETGLFTNVTYEYQYTGDQAVVIFHVEEETNWNVPVVFDNFVWFTDDEIQSAVASSVPSFAGAAPNSSRIIDSIRDALQRLLQQRSVSGQVEFAPGNDLSGRSPRHVFKVTSPDALRVCTLRFRGAMAVEEADLIRTSKPLIGDVYSRSFAVDFARLNLLPVYLGLGRLKAVLGGPRASIEAAQNCVILDYDVEEGRRYTWSGASWSGNAAISSNELNSRLGMDTGDVANGLKIQQGFTQIQEEYGKKGYLRVGLETTPAFDDAQSSVTYQITVNEGAQYRMGSISIVGINEREAARLQNRWRLRAGDVFDASYVKDFVSDVLRPDRNVGERPVATSLVTTPGATVDVTITVRN